MKFHIATALLGAVLLGGCAGGDDEVEAAERYDTVGDDQADIAVYELRVKQMRERLDQRAGEGLADEAELRRQLQDIEDSLREAGQNVSDEARDQLEEVEDQLAELERELSDG
jgi:hypothetical protein